MGRTRPSSTYQGRQQLDDGNQTIRTAADDGNSGLEDIQTIDAISPRGESNSEIDPLIGQPWNNWRLVCLGIFIYQNRRTL